MSQPPEHDAVPPQPGAPVPKPSSYAWWRLRFQEHPFKAVSLAVLTIGGVILLLFFIRLGVMPDLDLAGATATMAAVAMIGLLVVVALGGSNIAAGITTRNLVDSWPEVFRSRWMLGVLAAPAIVAFAVVAVWSALASDWDLSSLAPWILGLMVALLLAAAVALWRSGALKLRGFEIIMGLAGGGFLWLLLPLCSFVTFYALWPGDRSASEFGVYMAGWGVLCVCMNVFVACMPKERELGGMAFMGLGSVFILLALTENWTGIPAAAVRAIGLGETPVAMVLTEQGCHTLNRAARGQAVCRLDAQTKLGWACPVLLKSRIGSPFVVEVSSFDVDGRWPVIPRHEYEPPVAHPLRYQRIQISKADVLSWPSIKPLAAPREKFHFDADQLASYWHQDTAKMGKGQADWLRAQCGEKLAMEPQAGESSAKGSLAGVAFRSGEPKARR